MSGKLSTIKGCLYNNFLHKIISLHMKTGLACLAGSLVSHLTQTGCPVSRVVQDVKWIPGLVDKLDTGNWASTNTL